MKLGTTNIWLSKNRQKEFTTNLYGTWEDIRYFDSRYNDVCELYSTFMKRSLTLEQKMSYLQTHFSAQVDAASAETATEIDTETRNTLERTVQKLIDFFSEFEFEPSFRFVNTFAFACQSSQKAAKEYVKSYFELTDNAYTSAIIEKMKSPEFADIVSNMSLAKPSKRINSRLAIYYGAAGTGKTTLAMLKSGSNTIPCHSAMLPSDIMEDFAFDDGKAGFRPSAFWKAMVDGTTICLDELNLLPFETLRFLQNLLDDKQEFTYKGTVIKIAPTFNVIGTMNLTVNNCTYALPEPLVDRCYELKHFKLTADRLVGAIL